MLNARVSIPTYPFAIQPKKPDFSGLRKTKYFYIQASRNTFIGVFSKCERNPVSNKVFLLNVFNCLLPIKEGWLIHLEEQGDTCQYTIPAI